MKTYTITLSEWEAQYIGDLIEDNLDELEHVIDPTLADVRRHLAVTNSLRQIVSVETHLLLERR